MPVDARSGSCHGSVGGTAVRKLTVTVTFELDDHNRSFGYSLEHRGDEVYRHELAALFRRLGEDLEQRQPEQTGTPADDASGARD